MLLRPKRRGIARAFTLIELLVVISIIALLVGLLLPVLGSARDTAMAAACLANTRGIGQAGLMYANDHRGTWIAYYPGSDRKMLLHYYLQQSQNNSEFRDVDVWNCPSNVNAADPAATDTSREASYGFNINLNRARLHHIRNPSRTVGLADGGINDLGEPRAATHLWPPSRLGSGGGECRPNARHDGRTTAAWMDGHADAHAMSDPFYPDKPTAWTGNNITDRAHPDYKDALWDLY